MEKEYDQMTVQELQSCKADLTRIVSDSNYTEMQESYKDKIATIDAILKQRKNENPVAPSPKGKRKW